MAAEVKFIPTTIAQAVGPNLTGAILQDPKVVATAQAKVSAAAAAGTAVELTHDEAEQLVGALALQATALRWSGDLPVFRWKWEGTSFSPFGGGAAVGVDHCGPIMGRSDPQSRAALLALGRAIRALKRHVPAPPGVAAKPPISIPIPGGLGIPDLTGEKSSTLAPVVVGGIAVGALLIVGGAFFGGRYVGKLEAHEAAIVARAQIAADLARDRWAKEAETGKKFDPSALELGAADDIKEIAKAESSSRWAYAGIGAVIGVVGLVAASYASQRL